MSRECIKETLYDTLQGVDRTLEASTVLACGKATCAVLLMYKGLGEENKPILVDQLGECSDEFLDDELE